jgi:hypothetical protein
MMAFFMFVLFVLAGAIPLAYFQFFKDFIEE